MNEWVFFVEGPAEKELLEAILPALIHDADRRRVIPFEGKQDLEKQLVRRIRGYQNQDAIFFVLRDQDAHPDCTEIKGRLVDLCHEANARRFVVRISCREMESFFLADLRAVEDGLKELGVRGIAKNQMSRKFRSPDQLHSPANELAALTKGQYQKVLGSRAIAPLLDLDNQRSTSFHHLVSGIRRAARQWAAV